MFTAEEELKQIINYDNLLPPPDSLKPGFFFSAQDYPLLQSFKKSRDTIYVTGKNVVMQNIIFKDKEIDLDLYFIVSLTSCKETREQTIYWATGMTSMTMDAFTTGPAGIGEFNIISKHPPDEIYDIIHFVRNNIGVTVFLRAGKFDVARLAKQIDENIRGTKDYNQNTIKSISPQIKKINLPDKKIFLNKMFKIYIVMNQEYKQDDLLYFLQYDDDRVNLEDQDGPHAKFEALMPGETVINCTVVDRKTLLSTSDSIKINIFKK